MDSKRYMDDLSEIRHMMSKSSRFISLSGLSGILAGIYALAGAGLAYLRLGGDGLEQASGYQSAAPYPPDGNLRNELMLLAALVMVLALATALILSYRKAHRNGEALWTPSSRRLVVNFFIPLGAGGLFCLALLQNGTHGLLAPAMLIFYGLSCLNAGKYTLGDISNLGLANIVLGLVATQFMGYGLLFWALGFGVFHIFYGSLMHFKYDTKKN